MVQLYVKVLDFLVSATFWLEKGSLSKNSPINGIQKHQNLAILPGRFGVSIISQKWQKLEKKLQDMRSAVDLVDKEIQTRGEKDSRLTVLEDTDVF